MIYQYQINIEEQQLLQACREGDPKAQRRLYDQYVQAMYNRIVRMVSDHHAAEDLLQEVFIKVFRYLPSFKGEATIGAWIKRIAINTTIEYLRSNGKVHYVEQVPETIIPHPASMEEGPRVNIAVIHDAIKRLPAGARLVLNLFLLEGYQHQEIAQILEISESTSKSQYRRGRQLLQGILKERMQE